jgi:hypothetical protein
MVPLKAATSAASLYFTICSAAQRSMGVCVVLCCAGVCLCVFEGAGGRVC